MLIQELAHQNRMKNSSWSQALWIVFGSSRLGDEDQQEDFGLD